MKGNQILKDSIKKEKLAIRFLSLMLIGSMCMNSVPVNAHSLVKDIRNFDNLEQQENELEESIASSREAIEKEIADIQKNIKSEIKEKCGIWYSESSEVSLYNLDETDEPSIATGGSIHVVSSSSSSSSLYSGGMSFTYKGEQYTISDDYNITIPNPDDSQQLDYGFYKDGVLVITKDGFGYADQTLPSDTHTEFNKSDLKAVVTIDNVTKLGDAVLSSNVAITDLCVYANSLTNVGNGFLNGSSNKVISIKELHLDNLVSTGIGFLAGCTFESDINLPSLVKLSNGSLGEVVAKGIYAGSVVEVESGVLASSTFNILSLPNVEMATGAGFLNNVQSKSSISFPKLVSVGAGFLASSNIDGDVELRTLETADGGSFTYTNAGNIYLDNFCPVSASGFFYGKGINVTKLGDIYAPKWDKFTGCLQQISAGNITLSKSIKSFNYTLQYLKANNIDLGFALDKSLSQGSTIVGLYRFDSYGDISLSFSINDEDVDYFIFSGFFMYSNIRNVKVSIVSSAVTMRDWFDNFSAKAITINGNNLKMESSFYGGSIPITVDNITLNVKGIYPVKGSSISSNFINLNVNKDFDVSSIEVIEGLQSSFQSVVCPSLNFESLKNLDMSNSFTAYAGDSNIIDIDSISFPNLSTGTINNCFYFSNAHIGEISMNSDGDLTFQSSFNGYDSTSKFKIDNISVSGVNLDLNSCFEYGEFSDVNIKADDLSIKTIGNSDSSFDRMKLNASNMSLNIFMPKVINDSLSISVIDTLTTTFCLYGATLSHVDIRASKLVSDATFLNTIVADDIELSNIQTLGINFLYNSTVGSVKLPDLVSVDTNSFYLSKIGVLDAPELKNIGTNGFFKSQVDDLILPKLEVVGDYAFSEATVNTFDFPNLIDAGKGAFNKSKAKEFYAPLLKTLKSHTLENSKFSKIIIPNLKEDNLSLGVSDYFDGNKYKQLFLSSDTISISTKNSNPEIVLAKGSTDLTSYNGFNLYSMGYGDILNSTQLQTIGDNLAVLGNISSDLEIPDHVKLWVRSGSQAEQWCKNHSKKYGNLDTVECDELYDIVNPVVFFNTSEINKTDGATFTINSMGERSFKANNFKVYLNDTEIDVIEPLSLLDSSVVADGISVVIPPESFTNMDYGKYTLKVVFDNLVNTTYSQDVEIVKKIISIPSTPLVPANPIQSVTGDDDKIETKPESPINPDSEFEDTSKPEIDEDNSDNDFNSPSISEDKDIIFSGDDIIIYPEIDYEDKVDVVLDNEELVIDKDFAVNDKDIVISKDVFTDSDTGNYPLTVIQGNDKHEYNISVRVPSLTIRKLMGKNSKFKLKLFNTSKVKWIKWSSENTKMATVKNGVVRTKNKTGIVEVKCKAKMKNGYLYSFTIKIDIRAKIKHTKNYWNKAGKSGVFYMMLDKEIHTGVPVKINFNNLSKDAKVTYTTSNKGIAFVNKKGKIIGVKKGRCNIKVTIDQNKTKYVYYINAIVEKY